MKKRFTKKRRARVQQMTKPFLCRVDLPRGYEDHYPFATGDTVLMLGEIEQMPGHVAVALRDGRVLFGYHAEDFCRLPLDEA
jgi:hypothetical protein